MKLAGVLILFLIISSGLTYIYINYKSPNQGEDFVNVSILAKYNGKTIKTGFKIGNITGNTSDYYELIKIKKGWISIQNVNLKNQTFYEDKEIFNISKKNNRINLILDKPELPKIKVIKLNPLEINIKSSNFKDMIFCLKGSVNYILLKAINYTEIKKPEEFKYYDVRSEDVV